MVTFMGRPSLAVRLSDCPLATRPRRSFRGGRRQKQAPPWPLAVRCDGPILRAVNRPAPRPRGSSPTREPAGQLRLADRNEMQPPDRRAASRQSHAGRLRFVKAPRAGHAQTGRWRPVRPARFRAARRRPSGPCGEHLIVTPGPDGEMSPQCGPRPRRRPARRASRASRATTKRQDRSDGQVSARAASASAI